MVIDDVVEGMRTVMQQHVNYVQAFHRAESQIEGWFKGEMILLLEGMKRTGNITGFAHLREHPVPGGKQKYDFVISAEGATNAVEIKAWLIGKQKGTTYDARWYFTDRAVSKLHGEAEKLLPWDKGRKFILAYCYRRPEVDDWRLGVKAFTNAFPSYGLQALNEPPDGYPQDFFIGKLEVGAKKFVKRA